MPKPHAETLYAILVTEHGARRFLTIIGSIMTRPTKAECQTVLREWRRLAKRPRAGRVVRIAVRMR